MTWTIDDGRAITLPAGSPYGALTCRPATFLLLAFFAWRRGRRFRVVASARVAALLLALGCAQPASPTARAERTLLGGDSPLVAMFQDAEAETGVPRELLATLAFVETRLRMPDPTDDGAHGHGQGSHGLMGLPDPIEAARLIGVDPIEVRRDAKTNIRAGAHLLVARAAERGLEPVELADWIEVLDGPVGDEVRRRLERGWRGPDEDGRWVVCSARKLGDLPEGIGARTLAVGYSGAIWNPAYSGNYANASRGAAQINYIVIHTTQGSYGGTISWFKNPSSNVSAHYVVRSSDGELTQMVDDADIAWHDACFNSETIGIEHEGFVADPEIWYTEAMYSASARLTAWLADQYGVPKDRDHIFGHGEAPDCSDHTDPGSGWNWAHYMDLVRTGGTPVFAAAFNAQATYPSEMTSGEEAVVWFEFRNDGNMTWSIDETRLGTQDPQDRPSAFYKAGNWLSPSRPTGADHSNYGPGTNGRFTFAAVAPEVTEPTTFEETFQLVQEGVSWFGPTVTMTITVKPAGWVDPPPGGGEEGGDEGGDPGPGPDPDPGPDPGGAEGGCRIAAGSGGAPFALVTLCAILGLGVLLPRRRRR